MGQILPPNCSRVRASGGCSGPATYNGTYPFVWNNDLVDASFGITSAIFLDQFTPAGTLVNTLPVPSARRIGQPLLADNLVTSFSSKSEVALDLSTDGKYLTFMGYVSSIDNIGCVELQYASRRGSNQSRGDELLSRGGAGQ